MDRVTDPIPKYKTRSMKCKKLRGEPNRTSQPTIGCTGEGAHNRRPSPSRAAYLRDTDENEGTLLIVIVELEDLLLLLDDTRASSGFERIFSEEEEEERSGDRRRTIDFTTLAIWSRMIVTGAVSAPGSNSSSLSLSSTCSAAIAFFMSFCAISTDRRRTRSWARQRRRSGLRAEVSRCSLSRDRRTMRHDSGEEERCARGGRRELGRGD